MCEISEKLKLCTCKTKGRTPKNTWEYYRYRGPNEIDIMGETMSPVHLEPGLEAKNLALLVDLLNDGNVFDFDILPKYRDRLLLSFDLTKNKEDGYMKLFYEFVYKKGRWEPCEYDLFFHENNMKTIAHGKIVDGFTGASVDGMSQV